MNIEDFREYCLSLPCTTECTPFDDVTIVFKVCGKMFAYIASDTPEFGAALKCDPDRAIELREEYPDLITPGYHMNKRHWNTVRIYELNDKFVHELVKYSYDLVVGKLTKKEREILKNYL